MVPVPSNTHHTPLHYLLNWAPFKIDALGLVTLLGAEDVNKAVGRLIRSRYTTFLPILGAYVIAGNDFTNPANPGYTLYNVTDSITTTVLAGWFSRWLDVQRLKAATTIFQWDDMNPSPGTPWLDRFTNSIGIIPLLGLVAMTLLIGDYWGLANALAMAFSIFVRWYLVRANIIGLDQASHQPCRRPSENDRVKILITSPRGNMVTLYATRKIVLRCIANSPVPVHETVYSWVRAIGWLSFGVHIISLGQSCLVSQIYTVVLLVASTLLVIGRVGCDEEEIGYRSRLTNIQPDIEGPDRRLWAYAMLQPTLKEEERMLRWGLLPDRDNESWWHEFQKAKELASTKVNTVNVASAENRMVSEIPGGLRRHIEAQDEAEIEREERATPTPYTSEI
jgi:hypothetical protein